MIKKKEFIWNTIGSFILSMLNAIILAFCTNLNSLEIGGIFSISYATACIFNAIGDFGLRIYQVTDTNKKNSFSEYLVTRLLVVLVMSLVGTVFILLTGYRKEKLFICLLLIIHRAIENISETYQAEFQLNGRLELGGKTIVYRNLAGIIIFFILDLVTRNVVISLLGFVITNLLIFISYDLRLIKQFTKIDFKVNKNEIIKILKECLPLAISTLISMYVINAVKYAIDSNGDYTTQAYFNIIYMPTFIINMISIFIIKPFLKPFGDYWNGKEYKKFLRTVLLIIGALAIATLCIEIGCYLLGIPFLNIFYGVEVSMYKLHLLLLILSGFLYASSNVLFNALGTMRKQKLTTVTYILTAIFALLVPSKLVARSGMNGAVTSCIIIMGLLFFFMGIFFTYVYIKQIKHDKKV